MDNEVTVNEGVYELSTKSSLENLEAISDFIAESMRGLGAGQEKDIFEVQLAVDEAATNVIKHAYGGRSDGPIWVQCALSDSKQELIIKIKDRGPPFNPEAVLTPDTEAKLEDRKIGGLGIFFMKTVMQSVKYAFSDKGNELIMTRALHWG